MTGKSSNQMENVSSARYIPELKASVLHLDVLLIFVIVHFSTSKKMVNAATVNQAKCHSTPMTLPKAVAFQLQALLLLISYRLHHAHLIWLPSNSKPRVNIYAQQIPMMTQMDRDAVCLLV